MLLCNYWVHYVEYLWHSCVQGTQRGSGTSHSSSSSQLGSSPKLERRQRTGLHRTVAAVGQTEPAVAQHASSAGLDGPSYCAEADISKSSLERTGCLSVECDSPKDRDFQHDFQTASRTDVGSAVPSGMGGCDGNCIHSAVFCHENGEPSTCKPTSYCTVHHRKPLVGRRPQSASDIDRRQSAADCCFVSSSELTSTLEERFNKTLEMNLKLAEKLAATCRQMEVLTMKLREFEVDLLNFITLRLLLIVIWLRTQNGCLMHRS